MQRRTSPDHRVPLYTTTHTHHLSHPLRSQNSLQRQSPPRVAHHAQRGREASHSTPAAKKGKSDASIMEKRHTGIISRISCSTPPPTHTRGHWETAEAPQSLPRHHNTNKQPKRHAPHAVQSPNVTSTVTNTQAENTAVLTGAVCVRAAPSHPHDYATSAE
ncbi:hypothetical protein DQ04_01311130 [Trypanosoma grayi]|uniref:hypothetical protein n=1 Tax=Trypanosoma grayi TaxID=71804 RepID=UPI0004F46AC2|nr:hypothetical protein DQ04_01311130 [Trypanosoma grayi]KEG12954.1 hypothetical protein DQ04_01311130 [Trypanosoma grayi]